MAGDQSLHETYAVDRDYELWVIYFGDDEGVAKRYARTYDRLIRRKGYKWALARGMNKIRDGVGDPPFSKYAYVLLLDDDLSFPGGAADISRAFELAEAIRADIFQPAVANDFYTWEATCRIPDAVCHATNLVEIMMPGYSSEVFRGCVLPLLHVLQHVRAGWAIEPIVSKLGEALLGRPPRSFVLDEVAAVHTRPVSSESPLHAIGKDEAFSLMLFYAATMRELARFSDRKEAARFEFPSLDEAEDRQAMEAHVARARRARVLDEYIRRNGWFRWMLRRLIPKAGV